MTMCLQPLLKFFTLWNAVLCMVGHAYTHRMFDLQYMSFIVMALGCYMSYIDPGFFKIRCGGNNNTTIRIEGTLKLVMDLVLHIGVFAYIAAKYHEYYASLQYSSHQLMYVRTLLVFAVYLMLVDPSDQYGISTEKILALFGLASVAYKIIITK